MKIKVAFLEFFASFITITLDVVSIAMLIRMLLPLFMNAEDSKFYLFLAYITEPFIVPVRFLLYKFNILQDSPFDWSFTLSCLIIALLRMFLS